MVSDHSGFLSNLQKCRPVKILRGGVGGATLIPGPNQQPYASQYLRVGYRCCCNGIQMVMVVPLPGSLSTVIVPPCASMAARVMVRPTPKPLLSPILLPLKNGSKIRGCSLGGMPI